MAKKTNKTEHVLNLISKARETNRTEDDDVEIETIDSRVTPDLAFVDSQLAHDSELSQKIKETLVYDNEPQQLQPALVPKNMLEKVVMDAAKTIVEEEKADMVEEKPFASIQEPIKEPESYVIQSKYKEVQVEPLPNLDEVEPVKGDTPLHAVENAPEQAVEKVAVKQYTYINVLEAIVKDRVEIYMHKFGVCTCPRCVADTMAIALNGLPPKYVVIDPDAVSPMWNYLSTQYAGIVTTQLSRACIIVKTKPLH